MRSLVAIRAHRPTPDVARLHRILSQIVPDGRLVVVVDRTAEGAPQVWPDEYELVPFDRELLAELGLRSDMSDLGWRCGDYAYYALAHARAFDHAWLIEPDVRFAGADPAALLRELDASEADLVAPDIRRAVDWLWQPHLTTRGVAEPWRCFFPLTRLSRRAVDAARDLRHRVQWQDSHVGQPNDEGIVATAVLGAGLSSEDLRAGRPETFAHFHHRPKLTVESLAGAAPGVAHPVVDHEGFVRALRRELLLATRADVRSLLRGRRRRGAVRILQILADHALLTPGMRPAHEAVFGPADLQYRHYDRAFRARVLRTLPRHVRALAAAAGLVVLAYGRPRSA
ncbi:hypothetical protein [Agromyces sp. SYSU T00194]|uniref:hypothetical protein n=1 Tax=Agromyces chitinivorans TaxID=3158560 RepID=UPI00339B2FF5